MTKRNEQADALAAELGGNDEQPDTGGGVPVRGGLRQRRQGGSVADHAHHLPSRGPRSVLYSHLRPGPHAWRPPARLPRPHPT